MRNTNLDLLLYDTLTRRKRSVGTVSFGGGSDIINYYSCGPTVYHYAHLGNMRAYLFNDILVRVLRVIDYKVNYVMNITDVGHLTDDGDDGEDKLEVGANRENRTVLEVSEMYTEAFKEDIDILNIASPDIMCKATDNIAEQLSMIKTLEKKGYTYVISSGVYFDTSKIEDYTALSGVKLEEQMDGKRVSVLDKKTASDFCLWRFNEGITSNRSMSWSSPWGNGVPGWHIECSAMGHKYCKEGISIHTGGEDHIAVHHTNERAQNIGCYGGDWGVKMWVHNAHMMMGEKKMSKSSGDIIRPSDLDELGIHPLSFRLLTLQSHYRKQMKFSIELLKVADKLYKKLRHKISTELEFYPSKLKLDLDHEDIYKERFLEPILSDLNTAKGLSFLIELSKNLDRYSKKTASIIVSRIEEIFQLDLFKIIDDNDLNLSSIPIDVLKLIDSRKVAKENGDYKEADVIRNRLSLLGYKITDTSSGQKVQKITI
ncbi:MAG: cysteine--tRNA ligase [Alphaproteobacteria bacterium]|nr:cysteine--tRNA ligase [Alphaproteobacteria bacterium]MBL0717662.1 cysteine--tRNA ligase [Alphaproteobacteria bacterium]